MSDIVSSINHKLIFERMPVKRYLLTSKDDDFFVEDVNQAALNLFLYPDKNKVIGKKLIDVLDKEIHDSMYPSLSVSYKKRMPVTVSMPLAFIGNSKVSGFWVNPVFDDRSQKLYLDIIGQPSATDIAVIERERDDALSLLTSIFDVTEVGILVMDRNRRIIKTNDSFHRIFGWLPNETIGRDFLDFITDDERNQAIEKYKYFVETGNRTSGDVKIFRRDGTIANNIFTTATLFLSHGRQFQVVTIYDITKHKQMELSLRVAKEQADSANNAKSSFLANMSHELRTPLNAIIGFSEMMLNESFGPLANDKYKEYLGDVCFSAKHLLEIINEVLDMSKIEAGKIELDEQKIDLNDLICALLRIMSSKGFNANISIHKNLQEELPPLLADPRLIRQILINLITNSIKYSVHGGMITIVTRLNPRNEIEMAVADQGVGIPADKIKDALEPFGQIYDHTIQHDLHQGTGLGLPLAKAMLELHGGTFILHSIENKGTTVTMSFPASRTVKIR